MHLSKCYHCGSNTLTDNCIMLIYIPLIERGDLFWRKDDYKEFIFCSKNCKNITNKKNIINFLNKSIGLWYYTENKKIIQMVYHQNWINTEFHVKTYVLTSEISLGIIDVYNLLLCNCQIDCKKHPITDLIHTRNGKYSKEYIEKYFPYLYSRIYEDK